MVVLIIQFRNLVFRGVVVFTFQFKVVVLTIQFRNLTFRKAMPGGDCPLPVRGLYPFVPSVVRFFLFLDLKS